MSYRMNSFYAEGPPKFGVVMSEFLKESGYRASRPSIIQALMPGTNAIYAEDIKYMTDIANKIVAERKAHPLGEGKKDLLTNMLSGRDPKTGMGLTDDNITKNVCSKSLVLRVSSLSDASQ